MTAHQQRVALYIADLLMLEPMEEAAIVLAEALRLKAERMRGRRERTARETPAASRAPGPARDADVTS